MVDQKKEMMLRPCGQTMFVVGEEEGRTRLVLLVGTDVSSHFWLNILPFAVNPHLRVYLTLEDLTSVSHLMHVLPDVVPSFLVLRGGFFIDWFPAPLPDPHGPPEPQTLIKKAEQELQRYADVRP